MTLPEPPGPVAPSGPTAASTDCLVVGGGLIGLFVADALRRRGHEVTVLERGDVGGGASRGNAGEIVPALVAPLSAPGTVSNALRMFMRPDSAFFVHPVMSRQVMSFLLGFARSCRPGPYGQGLEQLQSLAADTFDLYAHLEERLRDSGKELEIIKDGFLYVFRSESSGRAARADFASRGLEVTDLWDRQQLREREPNLGSRAVSGFVARPLWSVDPGRLVDMLAAQLRDTGVHIHEHEEVVDLLHHRDGVEVLTRRGRYTAGRVVIAAGVWSRTLGRRLGARLPLVAGKGYSFEVALEHPLRRVIQFDDAHVVATPITNGVRIAGTMEFDRTVDGFREARVRSIVRAVEGYLRVSDWEDRRNEWVGPRPMTGSGLPSIGPVPGAPNVVVAAGHNMHGLSLGPVTGELVADLVSDRARPSAFPVRARTPLLGRRNRARRAPDAVAHR